MGLFNRKSNKPIEAPAIQIVEIDKDIIALGDLCLESENYGNFYVQDTVVVSSNAIVSGDIIARKAVIKGKVIGNVICNDELCVEETAVIEGKVMAHAGILEEGCRINGVVLLSTHVHTTTLGHKIAAAEKHLKDEKNRQIAEAAKTNVNKPEEPKPIFVQTESKPSVAQAPKPTQVQAPKPPQPPTPTPTSNTDNSSEESWW